MTRFLVLLCALAAVLGVAIGCSGGGGSDALTGPPPSTQMTLSATPSSGVTGQAVTFTVTASNTQKVLTSASIDYQSDGIWDDTHSYNESSFVSTFSHTYVTPGTYTVRAEVVDADQAPTTRMTTVTMALPTGPHVSDVSAVVRGLAYSGGGALPICSAVGPPVTCEICTRELDAAGTRISLGSVLSGTPVSVTQAFQQLSTYDFSAAAAQDLPDACYFEVSLYAGTAGSEVQFGAGYCTTQPTLLTCSITASGRVP